jgi:hypothetical protein
VAVSGNEIIAAGYATPNSATAEPRFALARYTAFGQLKTTFAGTGKVTMQIGSYDSAARPSSRLTARSWPRA